MSRLTRFVLYEEVEAWVPNGELAKAELTLKIRPRLPRSGMLSIL